MDRQVACKSIRTRKDSEIGQVMKEVRILMTLKHVSPLPLFLWTLLFNVRTMQPNINEIYDTEEDKKFMFAASHSHLYSVSDMHTVTSFYSSARAATYSRISHIRPVRETEFAKQKQSTSCTNYFLP